MGASIKVDGWIVDAAQNPPGPVRQKTVNPSRLPSQTHSGGSRDRPATAWPYYYDRKQ